ncbi:hypothetical protein BV22DRAFT_993081, partial [Leucogyrophana mollusca]
LLSQGDAQNVPRAVKLLRNIAMLQALGPATSQYNPTKRKLYGALKVLGVLCESLVEPFFNIKMSLKEQLKSLSTYAHLSFTLYRQHTTSFMSNQLYGDTQAMIKNIFFTVAKQRCFDDTQPVYIIQDDSDCLEGLFGDTRTQDHNPNMGVVRLCERLSSSADRADIFERHPDWDRGHRRLQGEGKLGADHTNPASWKGCVIAGEVSLQTEWHRGALSANAVLDT